MKWQRFIILTFLLASVFPHCLFAQKAWSLDQCINYALDNNFSIQRQELGVNIQKSDFRQAGYELLPSISAESSLNQYFGRSIDPTTNNYVNVQFLSNGYGIYSSIDLFNGFVKLNTLNMQKHNLMAEKSKLQQVRNQVAFNVMNGYFNVLLKQGLYDIVKANFQLSREQMRSSRKFVEVGRKPGTDLLESEAVVAADSFLLVQANHMLEQACLDLKYQMNFPVANPLEIDSILLSVYTGQPDTLTAQNLFQLASEALPELKIADNQVNAAKKAVNISQGAFSPRVGFYSGWNTQYMETNRDENDKIIPFSDQVSNNASSYLSLGIEIPLFSKFSKHTLLSKSKMQYQQSRLQYDDVKYKLMMEVEKSLMEWRSARTEYESSIKQQAKSFNAFQAAEKKLQNGLIGIIEFYIQKNNWKNAETEVLRTGLQLLLKERYLRFMMTGSLASN